MNNTTSGIAQGLFTQGTPQQLTILNQQGTIRIQQWIAGAFGSCRKPIARAAATLPRPRMAYQVYSLDIQNPPILISSIAYYDSTRPLWVLIGLYKPAEQDQQFYGQGGFSSSWPGVKKLRLPGISWGYVGFLGGKKSKQSQNSAIVGLLSIRMLQVRSRLGLPFFSPLEYPYHRSCRVGPFVIPFGS